MFDIRGDSLDTRSARLSNFTDRLFVFDGVNCSCLEGVLQALKIKDVRTQIDVCCLGGRAAGKRGKDFNNWKDDQNLWWSGNVYSRCGREYHDLITRIYDTVYSQDLRFKEDLLAVGMEDITHSIGNTDMTDTVLTEVEMIHQLNRLRIRALMNRQ